MIFKRFLPLALAVGFAITPALSAAPASADTSDTDAIVGAAVGALVGTLLFNSERGQYYYYDSGRPVYVSDDYARRYYSHRDPDFWREHHRDFGNRARFANEWNERHGGYDRGERGDWHRNGGGDRERGDWHQGGDRERGDWHQGGDRERGDWHHDGGDRDHGDWHGH